MTVAIVFKPPEENILFIEEDRAGGTAAKSDGHQGEGGDGELDGSDRQA
jgi:hypothetical protein